MNGVLVIGVFTVIIALTIFWLQGRQVRLEVSELEKAPVKEISVVKARDWPVEESPEESEPVVEKLVASVEEPVAEVEHVLESVEKDIDQLSGVGPKYRALLREAGITTINQIAESDPEDLLKLLRETNELAEVTKRPPTLYNVEQWIEAAKSQIA
jgi:predicted flap endonuclease-1-like 5' DNA nuclease